jgi:hypothetical protein
MPEEQTMEHTDQLHTIKMWMITGAISYDRAKEMAAPHLEAMNKKGRKIAKKHGLKHRPITFAAFMR